MELISYREDGTVKSNILYRKDGETVERIELCREDGKTLEHTSLVIDHPLNTINEQNSIVPEIYTMNPIGENFAFDVQA